MAHRAWRDLGEFRRKEGAMAEEPEVGKERPDFTESFERCFPVVITLCGSIGALALAGSIAFAVWLIGTFIQRFAGFLSSLVR